MADGVNLPAAGTGDTGVKASTQKVTADSSDVQDVSLTSVVGGVRTRNPVIAVSQAAASQADGHSATIGATGDASSALTLVGLLKNVKAALAGLLQANLYVQGNQADVNGGNRSNNTLRVTLATDQLQLSSAFFVTNAGTFPVQDSQKVADNAAFTDGTTPVQPVGYVFDDVAGTALTENDVAASRIDSKRAQVIAIEDGTTRGQRLQIDPSGRAFIDVRTLNGTAISRNSGIADNGSARVAIGTAGTGAAPTAFTSTTSAQIFASNALRKLFTVYNNSDQILYLMMAAAAASVTSYHVKVPPGGFYETAVYSGEIRGIMGAAINTGQVNPGEFV